MIIGTTKELKNHEYRVGLTPDNVRAYVKFGHTVNENVAKALNKRYTPVLQAIK